MSDGLAYSQTVVDQIVDERRAHALEHGIAAMVDAVLVAEDSINITRISLSANLMVTKTLGIRNSEVVVISTVTYGGRVVYQARGEALFIYKPTPLWRR